MANEVARALRKRMTIAEGLLWDELKELRRQGYHFRKQAPIDNYIVDFAFLSHRLIVEVDGAQHEWPENKRRDAARDAHLEWQGFKVLRYSNADVMENRDGVVEDVLAALGAAVRQD